MDVKSYLNRINYHGRTEPSADNLSHIHQAHMLTVPFENLNIHLKRPIVLDRSLIFQKVVGQKRGGFCYELNGLLVWLLENLGYEVTMLSARSINADGGLGIEHDHLMLRVTCPADEPRLAKIPWLVDVGWGDGFFAPKRLDQLGIEQPDGMRAHKIEQFGDFYDLAQRNDDGSWEKQYRFDLVPRDYLEFSGGCHFHQTSAESHFTKKRVCTQATGYDGRITLTAENFTETIDAVTHKRPIAADQFESILQEKFGITL